MFKIIPIRPTNVTFFLQGLLALQVVYVQFVSFVYKPAILCLFNHTNAEPGPAPRGWGAFLGRAFPNHCLFPPQTINVPPSEDCVPKESNRLRTTEVQLSETPQILIINPVFVGKNRLSLISRFFLLFTPDFVELCAYSGKKTFFNFFIFNLHPRIR